MTRRRLELELTPAELAHLRRRAKGWPSFAAWLRAQLNLEPPPGRGGPGGTRKSHCGHCGEHGH